MHTNFSTKHLREVGGKEYFEGLMKAFENNIAAHIDVYGPDNHLRLTGHCTRRRRSTSSASDFQIAAPPSACP